MHKFKLYSKTVAGRTKAVMGKYMPNNASAKWAVAASIGVVVFSMTIGGAVNAQSSTNSPGRFQMLIIPPNSNSYGPNDVVILDTQEGDLWKWYQYGGYPNSPENSSAIMYLGKAKPGAKPGDVVDKYVHPATPATRSK
jgi:hypothetical protein